MKYYFKNCTLIDGTGAEQPVEHANVYVNGELIEKISQGEEAAPQGYEVIDLTGKYLLPGLINMHAHLFGSGKPSKSMGGGASQQRLIKMLSSKLGMVMLKSMIKTNLQTILNSGVTSVRGVGDLFYSDILTRDALNAGKFVGPHTYVSGPAVTVPGGHGDGSFAITGSTVEELAAQTELVCSHKPDLIKTCVTGGVLDAKKEGEPGELKMSVEQTKAVCDVAHAHGYKVASHTESTEGLKVALEAGVDTIEHGAVMTDEIVSLFKSKGAALICTISPALPLAQLDSSVTLLPPVAKVNAKVVADGVIEGAKSAVAAGIPVGLGTDASCPFVSQYNTWAELYWFQKYVGVTNAFAIYSGTLQNARILGIGDKTGSVEVGKWADLIVTDNNPLEDLKALRNVTMVMCAGQLVKEPKLKKNPAIEEQIDKLL
jgi:imidazolonepropionase-like amidohydrolase